MIQALASLAVLIALSVLIAACDPPTGPSRPKKQPVPTTERQP